LARGYGADVIINHEEQNPVEAIRELTGEGVDSAIEALGTQATLAMAVDATRPGGTNLEHRLPRPRRPRRDPA
jgi:threonine dehydrogenase-like Zn-dependent dehydrogenase